MGNFLGMSVEMLDIPHHFKQFSHLKIAYLGLVAVTSEPVSADEMILKDVWFGFSFSGESLPTLEALALVKTQLYSTFSPRETQINSF